MLSEVVSQPTTTNTPTTTTFQLTGHGCPVNCLRFSSDGLLASGDKNGQIFIWDINQPLDNINTLTVPAHKNEILDIGWFNSHTVMSCSSDNAALLWDIVADKQVKKLRHPNWSINTIATSQFSSPQYVLTAGDDGICHVWDIRFKDPVHTIATKYPITSVATEPELRTVFTAGVDSDIKAWDMRAGKAIYELTGHENTVTSLCISKDSTLMISNASDNTIRSWDVRPKTSSATRSIGMYSGAQHNNTQQLYRARLVNYNQWVSSASSDGFAYIWDLTNFKLLGKIPGHTGSVNDVDMWDQSKHLATAGIDGTVIVGPVSF